MDKKEKKTEFEPRLTIGLVLRCGIDEISKIKRFLGKSNAEVVYQTIVGGDTKLIIKEVKKNENE